MKLFIKKGLLFLSLIVFLLLLLTLGNRMYFSYANPFSLDRDIHTLILGDSYSKYAFDDEVMEHTCNLSNDADSYFYSYQKLTEVVKINPQLETVLLSFSSHNIEKRTEDGWLLNPHDIKIRSKLYFPLLDSEDFFLLMQNKPKDVVIGLFNQILFPVVLRKGQKAYGGYGKLGHHVLPDQIEKQKEEGVPEPPAFIESSIAIMYIKKIIDYCAARSIKLILVKLPVHKSVRVDQEEFYQSYNNHFPRTTFYDFSRIEMEDSYFGDVVHLSPAGASYFSEWVEREQLLNIDSARSHDILYTSGNLR